MAASLTRANERKDAEPSLVALADPTQDLDAAVPEVDEIAQRFADDRRDIATQQEATSRFLRRHLGSATHLHFACHGGANLIASTDAALLLADGPLSLDGLAALSPIPSRVAVVSACQSGVTNIGDASEEGLSVASVLVGVGAACAIASLWPVEDVSTAILMSRLYEHLVLDGQPPERALRSAQLWLRDLDVAGRENFLDKHPTVRAEFVRRRNASGLGAASQAVGDADRPYAHPYFWAGFVAVGA